MVLAKRTAPPPTPLAKRTAAVVLPHVPWRLLHSTRPAQVGPLIAGIGVAAVAIGVKALFEAAQASPAVQEAVRQAAESSSSNTGSSSSAAATTTNNRGSTSAEETAHVDGLNRARSTESYFTTDVMGVDLGHGAKEWSGSYAAVLSGSGVGSARVVENELGSRSTPSVVAFNDNGEVLVGQPAKNLLFSQRATAITGHHLLHGIPHGTTEFDELVDVGALPYDVAADGDTGAALIRVHGIARRPEEISARVLTSLRASAEAALGGGRSVLSAVLSAPVNASEETRAALVAAGKRAGLHRIELLEEPMAAVLGAEPELSRALSDVRRLGVYDLGGRAFTFSLLERIGASAPEPLLPWSLVSAHRTVQLAGEQIDLALVESLVDGFRADHGMDSSCGPPWPFPFSSQSLTPSPSTEARTLSQAST